MEYSLLMKVVDSDASLKEVYESFLFDDFLALFQIKKQISVFCVLQYQIHVLIVLKGMIELDDMWMVKLFLNFYLSFQILGTRVLQ